MNEAPEKATFPEKATLTERPISAEAIDDAVQPFAVEALDMRGRAVRLGPLVDGILKRHAYPEPVSRLLGEAVALTALFGSALKLAGRFILQTQSDGPVSLLVVDFMAPDGLRAYARFDAERLAASVAEGRTKPADLLGRGHLAMTIDQGGPSGRYQGVVELAGQGLEEAAHQYFRQSEQIPTRVRLAVGQSSLRGADGVMVTGWRAGGLIVQFLPSSPERMRQADLPPGDAPEGTAPHAVAEDDRWTEARALAETVEDHELLDATLSAERLLYRLFHERGVAVFTPQRLVPRCSCSREKVANMIRSFSAEEVDAMVEDGAINVTCEFCSSQYGFDPADFARAE